MWFYLRELVTNCEKYLYGTPRPSVITWCIQLLNTLHYKTYKLHHCIGLKIMSILLNGCIWLLVELHQKGSAPTCSPLLHPYVCFSTMSGSPALHYHFSPPSASFNPHNTLFLLPVQCLCWSCLSCTPFFCTCFSWTGFSWTCFSSPSFSCTFLTDPV